MVPRPFLRNQILPDNWRAVYWMRTGSLALVLVPTAFGSALALDGRR